MPPVGRPGGGGRGPIHIAARPLNIVLQGNSIFIGGAPVTAPHVPATQIAAGRPGATVTDVSQGGADVVVLRSTFTANVASLYNSSRRNIVVALDTSGYINDRRGEAAFGGDGLSLSDPNAAGLAYYNLTLSWTADARAAGFQMCMCTAPNTYEITASPLSNNTLYQQARDYAHSLMRANASQYDYLADCANDARLTDTTNTTYFYADRIHMEDGGADVLCSIILASLPS